MQKSQGPHETRAEAEQAEPSAPSQGCEEWGTAGPGSLAVSHGISVL